MKIVVSPGPSFTANPIFKLLNTELEALGHVLVAPRLQHMLAADVFHINFPEHMVSEKKNPLQAAVKASIMLSFILIMRLRGRPVIWTVHDVLPLRGHNPGLCRAYMALVRKWVSGYIFLSKSSRRRFEELYPGQAGKPVLDTFHPFFPVRVLEPSERRAVRGKLSIADDDFVVGYLGDIKPYKNPDILRAVPEQLADGRKTMLLVAGRADGADKTFEAHLAGRHHLRIDRRLGDEELTELIQASDAVLLPYLFGWNSGFLFLVLAGYQKSVTSNLPIFLEMQEYFGDGWITVFNQEADSQPAIREALDKTANAISNEARTRLAEKIKTYSFANFAKTMEAFYMKLK